MIETPNGSAATAPSAALSTGVPPVPSRCRCGAPVFFRNTGCLACGAALGYLPSLRHVVALRSTERPHAYAIDELYGHDEEKRFAHCANFDSPARCNWLVEADATATQAKLCVACSLNRTIPDLSQPDNGRLWRRIETAKCHLVAQLLELELPLESWRDRKPRGVALAFDFKRAVAGAPVITGHDNGVITLNVVEADDVARESARTAMGEPYRTLLGHLRHEIGHYYWDRLVRNSTWLEPFREVFGSETKDYDSTLAQHYGIGPPAGWQRAFISAYASSHPWEDWAETWAHYLHMIDAAETAARMGIDATKAAIAMRPFGPNALWRRDWRGSDAFLTLLNDWVGLSAVMNEMCRSVGQADFYPFVLSGSVVRKLHFIHCLVHEPRH